MMRYNPLVTSLAFVSAISVAPAAYAVAFTVSDIRIEGLVRLSPASVYALLPIAAGDQVDDAEIADAVRKLYGSGNFEDIQVDQSANILIFKVVERPLISKIELQGNKLIPKEGLLEGMKRLGISEGEVLKKAALQNIQTELEQQYVQQGRYNSKVNVDTIARPNNRVELVFKFTEGTAAKVVDVNVIGNTVFKESDILRVFAIKESNWSSIVTRNDRYAKEKLNASLEALRALYLNAGYINFNINHAKLDLSPDKKRIFIEVGIDEGQKYKFGQTKFLGDALFDNKELQPLQIYRAGDTYSQAQVNAVKQLLLRKYGNAGYYFAEIAVAPEINNENKTVDLNYYINPGQQVTVRRINFSGNSKTNDEVLRREMRQMEGALASNEKIELSKVRLERTGFFKSVDIKPIRVPNAPDQMDLDVRVEEQQSGTSTIAVGYSQGSGVTYQFGLSQTNFLGTGNRVSIDLSRSDTVDYYNLNVYDPYFTLDGVSRGYSAYYRKTKLSDNYSVNNYVTDALGGSLTFGYPLDENQNVSATLNVDQTKVRTGPYVSTYVRDYLLNHEGKVTGQANYCSTRVLDNQGNCTGDVVPYDSAFEGKYLTYNLNLSWAYNTLNRPIFPTQGMYHRVSLDAAIPGSDITYQKLTYDTQAYVPLWKDFVLRGYGKLGYGNNLPFYKNYFAGGYGSVRGYDINTLGPRYPSVIYEQTGGTDPDPETVGGNALVQAGLELAIPLPTKADWARQIRPVLFVEGGQVFDTACKVNNYKVNGTTIDAQQYCKDNYNFDFNNMRYSAGVGLTWITMIGPLSLSYAVPFNDKEGDKTKSVQFQIGQTF